MDLLQCRPERVFSSELDAPGERIIVLRPRFLRGPLAWWLQPQLKNPYLRVRLDEIGTFVWQHCDGLTTISQIAAAMETHFGQRVSPALERLRRFLHQLQNESMIRLQLPDDEN